MSCFQQFDNTVLKHAASALKTKPDTILKDYGRYFSEIPTIYRIVGAYIKEKGLPTYGHGNICTESGYCRERAEFAKQLRDAIEAYLKPAKAPKVPTINLRKATRQRIFEFALRHVRKQGRPGVQDGMCAYRTLDGAMCAVGAMLTDEQVPVSGGIIVNQSQFWQAIAGTREKVALLKSIQEAHDQSAGDASAYGLCDNAEFLATFEKAMQHVAKAYHLVYKPPGMALRA